MSHKVSVVKLCFITIQQIVYLVRLFVAILSLRLKQLLSWITEDTFVVLSASIEY